MQGDYSIGSASRLAVCCLGCTSTQHVCQTMQTDVTPQPLPTLAANLPLPPARHIPSPLLCLPAKPTSAACQALCTMEAGSWTRAIR